MYLGAWSVVCAYLVCYSVCFHSCFRSCARGRRGAEESGIQYLEMKPKFTVNLSEPKKYLMIQVQLLLEDIDAIAKIKKHMPI